MTTGINDKNTHVFNSEINKKRPFSGSTALYAYIMCWVVAFACLPSYRLEKVKNLVFSFDRSNVYFLQHNVLAFIATATFFIGTNYFFPFFVPVFACFMYAVMMYFLVNLFMADPSFFLGLTVGLTLLAFGYIIYFIFKHISSITSTIKASSSLIFTNILTVLTASILLGALTSLQTTTLYLYITNSPFKSPSTDHPLFFLDLFLQTLSVSILFNFVTVFISSVIYNSCQKTGVTVLESLIIALSSFPAIFKSAFFLSGLAVLNKYLEILYENETRKPQKERNMFLIIAIWITIIILNVITRIFQEMSFLIMNYIGIYGGDFDVETSAKANQILTFEDYQAYRNSGFGAFAYLVFMIFYGVVLYIMDRAYSIFNLWSMDKYDVLIKNLYDSTLSSPEIVFLSTSLFISLMSFFFICSYNTASVAYLYAKMKNSQHY